MRAATLGYQALAITDHDGLYGAMEFAQACAAVGVQPITGVELTLVHGFHLTLLAEHEQGYANLCRLITLAHRHTRAWEPGAKHLPAADPRPASVDPADFQGLTDGLIVLSGCRQSEVSQLVDRERFEEADHTLHTLADLFGWNNTFVEVQHNLVQ